MTLPWPDLDHLRCQDTCAALHLYLQVVEKCPLAHTPWVNRSWHATFYVTARGWTSSPLPDGPDIEVKIDLLDHRVIGRSGAGRVATIALGPMSVAAFHAAFLG